MRALVFDFDGLILDTETPEFRAWQETFRWFGVELPLEWWALTLGVGASSNPEPPTRLLARLTDQPFDPDEVHRETRARVVEAIHHEPVRPGVRELLTDCRTQGIPAAIASSSKHDWIEPHLDRLGLRGFFSVICGADDVTHAKPAPDLYLLAAERLGAEPGEAIALEDSPNGIRAALAANMPVVVVPNPVTAQLDVGHANARLESLEGVSFSNLVELLGPPTQR